MCDASAKYGRPVPHHHEYKAWLQEAEFVDVEARTFKIPSNSWPKDKQLKEVGKVGGTSIAGCDCWLMTFSSN